MGPSFDDFLSMVSLLIIKPPLLTILSFFYQRLLWIILSSTAAVYRHHSPTSRFVFPRIVTWSLVGI